jgi:CO dehydrogenase maturation factor
MKLLVCGKGGSGKSTVAVLMARAYQRMGKRVLLVDADESNLGLHRLAGAPSAETLLEALGGKAGLRARKQAVFPSESCPAFYETSFSWEDIPEGCVPDADGIRLLKIGKIKTFGEGCACPMGGMLRPFLAHFRADADDRMVVDMAAGVEHFGRSVDARADHIIGVIDPSFESFKLARSIMALSREAGTPLAFVLNKTDARMREALGRFIDPQLIWAELREREALFMAGMEGRPIDVHDPQIDALCRRLEPAEVLPDP